MKDYKGRGSDLQFREPKTRPAARLLAVALGIAALGAGIFYGVSLLTQQTEPDVEASAPSTPTAIPLRLPPTPERRNTPTAAGDGVAQ